MILHYQFVSPLWTLTICINGWQRIAADLLVPVNAVVERSRYAAAKNLKSVYTPIFAQFRAPIEKECTP